MCMNEDLPNGLDVGGGRFIPFDELEFTTSRASGPGGQHVNKTNSRVTLRWDIANSQVIGDFWRHVLLDRLRSRLTSDGVLIVSVDEMRSQYQNRQLAMERMAAIVAAATRKPKARVETRPSKAAEQRRLDFKHRQSERKAARHLRDDDGFR